MPSRLRTPLVFVLAAVGFLMRNLSLSAFALLRCLVAATLALFALAVPCAFADNAPTGEQIYRNKCASCHGANGEGTPKHYHKPLAGNRSVPQLTRLIAETMPKDDPGTISGPDAAKVAGYIHDTFYSLSARIEFSRLTVRQHQNAVADLIAGFRGVGQLDDKHGLRGEYFGNRRFGDRVIDRLDPGVRFDFKTNSPDPKIKPEEFSIRWQGSVLAPETGDYEFIVRAENGLRLWVNDEAKPLIDAEVRSGKEVELTGTIRLLGGRAYPIRLDFFKSKEAKEKTASVALEWKPPYGAVGSIPPQNLTPSHYPEAFVIQTAFPPDDRSLGWERGTTVSKAWDQAATDAALETAGYVTTHLRQLADVRDDAADRKAKLQAFCQRFVERAFRRPLTDEQKRFFIDRFFEKPGDLNTAVKRVVLLALLSPRFIYREADALPDEYDTASRLSFALWDSPPDQDLLDAAKAGKLADREQVSRQAERLLADERAHAKLREFFHLWLKLDPAPDVAKDAARFPGFDPAVVADLRTSLDLFLDDAVWNGNSDFRQLLLSDDLYLNGRLAKFYGANLPADAPFQKVKLNPQQRAGILTHPYMMAAFAHTDSSSPILRGVFLVRGVLGVTLRPPPEAFIPLPESQHPDLTTRDRVVLQTKPTSCMSCHGIINPLGFTLEHFDAVGRFRDQDNNRPIDSTGSYLTRTGETKQFAGARDLAEFLAGSEEVQTALVEQLFRHLAKQSVRAYGPKALADLQESFAKNGYSIRKLTVEAATTAALQGREMKAQAERSGILIGSIGLVGKAEPPP
jgi:mono/diheme cytochrome c family protein